MADVIIQFESVGSAQAIARVDDSTLAADAMNVVIAEFDLGAVWAGFESYYARFIRWDDGAVYDIPLASLDVEAPVEGHSYFSCAVPHEVMQNTGFYLAIFSVNGDEQMLTSARLWVPVEQSGGFAETTPLPSTPDLLTQFYQWVQQCINISQDLRDDAAAGEFDGAPFTIAKTYPTIEAMTLDFETEDVKTGEFVMISSEPQDADNSKLYRKDAAGWTFISDLSGGAGMAATVDVGNVTEGDPWSAPTVGNSGNSSAAVLDFSIPGTPDFSASVSTLASGSNATVQLEKEDGTVKLSFGIPKGADGTSVTILGGYDSLEDLQSAHPTGNPGDAYIVQGDMYIWDGQTNAWLNVGRIKGDTGEGVPQGGTAGQTIVKQSGTEFDTAWGQLGADGIANGAVTGDKIANGAVSTGKLANGFVLPLANGGTGADNLDDARDALGIKPAIAGMIYPYAGETPPVGFLLCDGQAVSRTQYAALFLAIGTTYGAGDGETTFNVPDLRTRVPVGAGSGYELGGTGGAANHTLTADEIPAHTHSARTNSTGAHSHQARYTMFNGISIDGGMSNGYALIRRNQSGDSYQGTASNVAISAGAHSHTVTVNNTGGGQSHNNMQPYTIINYVISTGEQSGEAIEGDISYPIAVSYGGTGATSAPAALGNLGFYKKLWSGTWSNGSISVPGVSGYGVLLFVVAGYNYGQRIVMTKAHYHDDAYPDYDIYYGVVGSIAPKESTYANGLTFISSTVRVYDNDTLQVHSDDTTNVPARTVRLDGTQNRDLQITEIYGLVTEPPEVSA